jgi:hypothetical protein
MFTPAWYPGKGPKMRVKEIVCLDGVPLRESKSLLKPLSYSQKRLLSAIESNPGLCRAELAKLLYQEMNPYYSTPKVSKMVKALEQRGLVEFDVIHEGGRQGVSGLYLVGQKRIEKPGYLGVFGWVDTPL